jgi:biotin carboxylase
MARRIRAALRAGASRTDIIARMLPSSPDGPVTLLALASEVKGLPFIEECKRQGCRVILLMNEHLRHEPWPWQHIDEHYSMRDIRQQPDVTIAVSRVAAERRIDQIVALDDYDVETAAALREHFQLGGMNVSAARLFRDKLAMRTRARECGLLEPEFTGVFNREVVGDYLDRVAPPWVLKPRSLAGSEGIRMLPDRRAVWQALDELGERRGQFLLEQFIAGNVYHVDALVWRGEVVFALASRYGAPPMAALQGRGVFSTRTLDIDCEEAAALRALNVRLVIDAMGRSHGPTHTEFIRDESGQFHFLETAARVAGGYIEKMIEAASGVAMWQEAARMELALLRDEPYRLPVLQPAHAGLIAAPSRRAYPDTSSYAEAEVYFRPRSREFVSLIVRAPAATRVDELLATYAERFRLEFMP